MLFGPHTKWRKCVNICWLPFWFYCLYIHCSFGLFLLTNSKWVPTVFTAPVFGFAYLSLQILPTGFYWAYALCPVYYKSSKMSGLPLLLGLEFISVNKHIYIIHLSLHMTILSSRWQNRFWVLLWCLEPVPSGFIAHLIPVLQSVVTLVAWNLPWWRCLANTANQGFSPPTRSQQPA